MKQVTINIYKYHELPEEAKQKVLQNLYDINVDLDWWESVYYDLDLIGLKCNGFDIDRGSHCNLDYTEDGDHTYKQIIENHGKTCDTYLRAKGYEKQKAKILEIYKDNELLDEYDMEKDLDELEKEFLKELEEEYLIILRKEFEYRTSEKAIDLLHGFLTQ